ncbi:TetR/AcrR family transcriptional regulator [Gottfriedia solisilvae]|uniref:TetR family transcriptional regulator n=1 Tax=Gottfriedia solisilvae TaxID=1516104 RepID=A0A8J3F2R7_9BACI|nr:TetR/AcrR family transcriptional regulator [Gottfriedia solisilvae]GGI18001.1 TetR family transcriptional regulator [Gottfriedia solisilvae]
MRKTLRTHILKVASELFNNNGIQATGVDKIVAEADVAKMTLYKHFPSKDDLVIAYLNKKDEEWRSALEQTVNENGNTPVEKILAIFDYLDTWFKGSDFQGCTFINTAAEFSGITHPFHEQSAEHKKLLLQYLVNLVKDTGIKEYEEASDILYFIIEGAIVTELIHRKGDSAIKAREGAKRFINSYIN